jgi:lipid-A-disaccharide synthase
VSASANGPVIFLIAGEASGDVLGQRLMAALKKKTGGHIRFEGVGGALMQAEGLNSRFPMSELSLLGIAEIVPHLPRLLRRIRETVTAIKAERPAALVTIDAPAFCLRVSAKLAGTGIPRVHYVAPQHWAWRPGRARELKHATDHLMGLLPFEPDFFKGYGVDCAFVGHPVVEGGAGTGDGRAFRARHAIAADAPVLVLLPGSRRGEVTRLMPVFRAAIEKLAATRPGLQIVLPTVAHVAPLVRAQIADWAVPALVTEDAAEKFDAFAAATAALAASGTVALELALSGAPCVISYRIQPITGLLAKLLLTVEFVSLVNIVVGRLVVPELIQKNCTPEKIAGEVGRLLDDDGARALQRMGFKELADKLGVGGPSPSERAAEYVLGVIGAA